MGGGGNGGSSGVASNPARVIDELQHGVVKRKLGRMVKLEEKVGRLNLTVELRFR